MAAAGIGVDLRQFVRVKVGRSFATRWAGAPPAFRAEAGTFATPTLFRAS
jgi:hypothetical protein